MKRLALAGLVVSVALAAQARVFMTQQQALAGAFPAGTKVVRQTVFLTRAQIDEAKKKAGVDFSSQLVVRYAALADGKPTGFAYFETHRVRTLPETIMVVIGADGRITAIEILSFDEPADYAPKERWIAQFKGRKLDDELSLKRAIRPMSGASLTGRAILDSSRKILAIHDVIGPEVK
jgi:uncharacterized protein with FMN-binding domain